jgi:hypothetical protein
MIMAAEWPLNRVSRFSAAEFECALEATPNHRMHLTGDRGQRFSKGSDRLPRSPATDPRRSA